MFQMRTQDGVAGKSNGKPKSPQDVLTDKITHLAPGQELVFGLSEIYGPELIVFGLINGSHDKPKYDVSTALPVNGKPGEKRNHIWNTGKPKTVASWLLLRNCRELS